MTIIVLVAGHSSAHEVLDASTLNKYLDPLPNPLDNVIAPIGMLEGVPLYDISISQFQRQLHSELPPTTVWGYNGLYPGPTFVASRDEAIKVRWTNNLTDGAGHPLQHLLPYDPTLHGAGHPDGHGEGFPQARTVTHLHGGVVDEHSDGYPEHWFTPDPHAAPNGLGGPAGNSLVTTYANPQRSASLWYHDHAMGITRLNVYAGLAGFYLIRDAQEESLGLPSGDYEIPLVLQDRSFYDNGDLFYPGGDSHDPSHPGSHVSFFLADANLVNGVVWPFLEVEPRKYRFRMLNGANGRFYDLSLEPDSGAAGDGPVTLHQIGTDGGLLSHRVERSNVFLAPSDRADIIVDFSQFSVGDSLRFMNNGLGASEGTTDEVMQFRIVAPRGVDDSNLPDSLSTIERYHEADADAMRTIELVPGFDAMGRRQLLLNGMHWSDEITEVVRQGDLEIWSLINRTGDAHPIHLHGEAFQVLDRTGSFGNDIPLEDYELGWEDTVVVNPGETVRIMVKYEAFTGTFVFHCHILEHEDHEMMRPFRIIPAVPEPSAWTLVLAGIASTWLTKRRRLVSRLDPITGPSQVSRLMAGT